MLKKILAKIFVSCVSALLLSFFVPRAFAIHDRLIMEVNGVHYTQLHAETYFFVRTLLNANSSVNFPAVNNWQQIIAAFEALVLLEQESNRIGGYLPSRVVVEKALEKVESKIQQNEAYSNYSKKIGLSKAQLQRIIQNLLQVESMRRSRTNRLVNEGETFNTNIQKEDATLIQDLKSRAFIRHYEGANQYKVLEDFPS